MNEQEPILWLRFIGEELYVKALPIYELGTVLIAFQRDKSSIKRISLKKERYQKVQNSAQQKDRIVLYRLACIRNRLMNMALSLLSLTLLS